MLGLQTAYRHLLVRTTTSEYLCLSRDRIAQLDMDAAKKGGEGQRHHEARRDQVSPNRPWHLAMGAVLRTGR